MLTKVTRNFQITLPKGVRNFLGVRIGDTVILTPDKDEVRITKMEGDPVRESFGTWPPGKDSVELVRELRADSERRRMRRLGL